MATSLLEHPGALISHEQHTPRPWIERPASGEPLDQYVARVTDIAYRIAEAMIKQGRRLKKETTYLR